MTKAELEDLTFGEKLKAASESDPRFARSVRRLRWAALFLLVAAAFGMAVAANVVNFGQSDDITNVHNDVTRLQKTPCSRNPVHPNKRCEGIRQALGRGESIVTACIAHQRVEGTRGRNCGRFYVDVANRGAPEEPPAARSDGGDAPQSAPSATQQAAPDTPAQPAGGDNQALAPGKGGSHGGSEPDKGGTDVSAAPGESGSSAGQAPTSASTSSDTERSSSTTVIERTAPVDEPQTEPDPERPVPAATGGAVERLTDPVLEPIGGTVETVTGKACEASGLLCPK